MIIETLQPGDEVYFNDPDGGLSSGVYTVLSIISESGTVEEEDTIIVCKNEAGGELECFACELSWRENKMANYYTRMTVQPFIPADLLLDSDLEFLSYFGIYFEGGEEIYLYAEEYHAEGENEEGDTFEEAALIDFFQAKIKESGGRLKFVSFEFAYIYNKIRPEAFGGAAYFITAEDFKYFGTQSWLMQQMEEVKKCEP